jgi:hypothetical protein
MHFYQRVLMSLKNRGLLEATDSILVVADAAAFMVKTWNSRTTRLIGPSFTQAYIIWRSLHDVCAR